MKQKFLALILLLSGCGLFEMQEQQTAVVNKNHSDVQKKIIDSLQDATKEDCETIYKIFSGVSMYIENSSRLTKFSEVLKIINDVQIDYKWSTGTYIKLTDIIEEDLTQRGYEEDKQLDSKIKKDIHEIFKEYSNAIIAVLKEKDA